MGVSTDAILTYGISPSKDGEGYDENIVPWYDLYEDNDESEPIDFETWWQRQCGVSDEHLWKQYYEWEAEHKTGDYSKDHDLMERFKKKHPDWDKAYDEIWDKKKEVDKLCPVEVVRHCSCDYPMYILAVKNHTTTASRGYPVTLDNESMNVDLEQELRAKDFCEKYNIEWKPQWWLVSDWC